MLISLNDFERKLIELVRATTSRGKNSIRNAWNHLDRAWTIRETDPTMAAFRAITAEEEAASGVIWAVRDRGYTNATRLSPRNHLHKHAIYPLLEVLSDFFSQTVGKAGRTPSLRIGEPTDPKRLKICIPIMINGERKWVMPDPPLNMKIEGNDGMVRFTQGVHALASSRNADKMIDYVKTKANQRNQLLYAWADGYPDVKVVPENYLAEQKAKVLSMTIAFLLIEPYREKQPFVEQCLTSLLEMMELSRINELEEEV